MTTAVGYTEFTRMLDGAIRAIQAQHEALSRLDSAIGDGDHGVTMLRAVNKVQATIAQAHGEDLKSLINDIAWTLLGIDGGATGPLLGSLFMGMADAVPSALPLDGPALAGLFEAGLAAVQEQTRAKVGDKTMMDALIPAVRTLREGADAGVAIEEMLHLAARAAAQGAVATRDLPARFGRARNLGDRTIGTPDPGATSMSIIFQGFYDGLIQPVAQFA